uniref:Putative ribonuclease H-like domain-containing protein n=1 Tax=Tanacetum cinerariifolium TaxID=118510 RepID=A0A6L2K9E2_TANCI|nr:putative ribonuclease H-like domain-containing protein [Tanacetum cinerariifolium]
MTRSLNKEFVTPYTEPKRVLHLIMKLFKTLSLDYLSSPKFDLFSDHENHFEEEITDTMAETMEQYMTITRDDYGSEIARPKFDDKAKFELKGQFLKEIRENTFSGSNNEDANEHIKRVLEIADLFTIPVEIKKVNKKVYAAQVGCELCNRPHYTKDFPLKEEGKKLEEAYYTQIDFVILDMPEDPKPPLILRRPFLSTAHAKIDVFKIKFALRVGSDKLVFKSNNPANHIVIKVYVFGLRERMELDLEARLMGEALFLNGSRDLKFRDYKELNDLNEPLELRNHVNEDLGPTIDEGEVIDKLNGEIVETRNDNVIIEKINEYPSLCDYDRKIKDNYFAVVENMDNYRDEGMGDIIIGKPFCGEVCVDARRSDRLITIYNDNCSVTYQMARTHPKFKHLSNEQCNKIWPLLKISPLMLYSMYIRIIGSWPLQERLLRNRITNMPVSQAENPPLSHLNDIENVEDSIEENCLDDLNDLNDNLNVAMKMEDYLSHTDYLIWKVIQNGNGPVSVITDPNGMIKVLPPKTAEEVVAREWERKARTTLLMALLEDHLEKLHKMADAKEMWEAIKSRFGGNDESNKMQKYLLKQQFEEIHGAGISHEDANQKFLRSLPSSWSQVALIIRTKPGLDTLSFDDLYNNLRVFERDVKALMIAPQLDYDDLKQINDDDMEEMDLKWHFARDCRAKGNQDSRRRNVRYNGNKARDYGRSPAYQDNSKALVTIDGEDIDWSGHVEEDTQNYAMMAYSSSNSGSDNESVFMNKECDLEDTHVNDRFAKRMHAFPSPMTGNYMPSGPDVEIDYSKFTYGPKQNSVDESYAKTCESATCESDSSVETTTSMAALVDNASQIICQPKVWTDAPIIEEYESDSDDDSVSNIQENIEKSSFAFTDSVKHVKSPRENVKETGIPNHCPKIRKHGRNGHTRKGLGYDFTRKSCFVCGSFSHLIRDCDFHEKRMAKQAELPQAGISAVKGNRDTAVKASDNPHKALKYKGIINSGCSRLMTGNKAHLADYQEFKGGSVAFGGSNGRITGKGKIKAGRLYFEDVYYVKELKHYNLFSVSQMCYKKNKKGKQHKAFCKAKTVSSVNQPLQILHMDLFRPTSDGTTPILKDFIRQVENQFNHKIKTIRSDNGTKFKNHELIELCGLKEIKREYSNARTLQQNGVTERKNRTLIEAARTMLVHKKLTSAGTQANDDKGANSEEIDLHDEHFVLPIWFAYSTTVKSSGDKIQKTTDYKTCEKLVSQVEQIFQEELENLKRQENEANDALRKEATHDTQDANTNSTNLLNAVSAPVSAVGPLRALNDDEPLYHDDPLMPYLEDIYASPSEGIFTNSSYDDEGVVTDFNNLETTINTRSKVHKNSEAYALKVWILVDLPFRKKVIRTKWVYRNKTDKREVVIINKAKLVAQGHQQEEGIDYDEVFAPVTRIEAIRIFLPFASYMGFIIYQMDVKSAFLYDTIEEEVYVTQPPGFIDPKFPNKVYKVVKALYGLYKAPRAWYATMSTFVEKSGYRRGAIDKTLFIKQDKKDIMLVQVYMDDIIFGSIKKSWCDEFEELIKNRFQMSSMGELTFFLGLQVKQKKDGIFISQYTYVAEILKKFDFISVKTASTPIETRKPLVKDEEAANVDVHIYRSMIGSLMYLTASRPDIMFAVCACSRFQVTPKTSRLQAVKRIFRYLKGQPKLGLWYPKVSSFDLKAYSDSDYAGANLDRKSITKGCQFLDSRLISWQCKKQTIVATSTIKAEYVAAAHCFTLVKGRPLEVTTSNQSKELASPKQTALGKDELNLLIYQVDEKDGIEVTASDLKLLLLSILLLFEEIFAELARIGYEKPPPKLTFYKAFFSAQWKFLIHNLVQCMSAKRTAWNEFSCSMASAVICLATAQPAPPSSPPQEQPTTTSTFDMTLLNTLLETYTTLSHKVAALEKDKVAQALEILKLKRRVKKLEKQRRSKSSSFKRLKKVDADKDITLVDMETEIDLGVKLQGRLEEKDEVNVAAKEVNDDDPIVFNDEEVTMTMAQTLIKIKAKKARLLDEQTAKRMHDEEVEQAAAREKQEKDDFKRAQELQQQDEEPTKKRGAKETLLHESLKKLRAEVKVSGFESTQDTPIVNPKELSEEDVKNMIIEMPTKDKEKALWVELKRLYKANAADVFWKLQRYMHDPFTWKLYTNCGVHQVSSTKSHDIFMFPEKDYPLTDVVLLLMLSTKLQVDEDCEMVRDLVMKIFKEANKPKSRRSLDTSSN